jgi:translation elongation factor EF-1alpha
MYLTGMVEKRTLEKYEREAKEKNRETWYLSWALDTNLEGLYFISTLCLSSYILVIIMLNFML